MTGPATVSVIVPTTSGTRFIEKTVQSILDNYYPRFELIVVDASSNRDTESLLKRSFPDDPRIIYVHTDKLGVSYGRNLGIHHATGELILFTDDDVVVSPGWIEAYVTCYRELTAAGIEPGVIGGPVEGLWEVPRPSWWPKQFSYLICEFDMGNQRKPYKGGALPFTANMCSPKATLLKVGGFNEEFGPAGRKRGKLTRLGGEDTLCVSLISRLGLPLYYEPSAKVCHMMVKERLTQEYFLRRIFWEGAIQLNVWHALNVETRASPIHILSSNLKKIIKCYSKIVAARINLIPADQSDCMRELGEARFAMGQLYWLSKILGSRTLCNVSGDAGKGSPAKGHSRT